MLFVDTDNWETALVIRQIRNKVS